MAQIRYTTPGGITVTRTAGQTPYSKGLSPLLRKLDRQRGLYLSSGYEYPGRYSRWDVAIVCPPVEIVAAGRQVTLKALNQRGGVLLQLLEPVLAGQAFWEQFGRDGDQLTGTLRPVEGLFPEEERSKQPSAFSVLRALMSEFANPLDSRLGLAGAFGFDLLFRFDPIELKLPRDGTSDLRLFLFDEIYLMDRKKERIERFRWDFAGADGASTEGLPRDGQAVKKARRRAPGPIVSDHEPAEYMRNVEQVRAGMKQGDYYEVVLRQTFSTPYAGTPSALFEKIQRASPSPYEFLIQFGDEQLVGASPEMFVRIEGRRIETCPISGTARRTGDPLADHEAIKALLASAKEESELTMCTDVDRNDKSRVCVPGTVQIAGRRLIESYAGLFHTVDHVTGELEDRYDSLDAFLTHMWAVTVIGAPKRWAAQAVENLEKSARAWYGGAIGMIAMNGDINTGITIRTAHLKDGLAQYSAGATILYDSDPAAEAAETRLKATGFFRVFGASDEGATPPLAPVQESGLKLLLADNDDCFIHTLANYTRQAGARVVTYRHGFPREVLTRESPDLVLVSPGPGRPADFGVPDLIRHCAQLGLPVFGVCLGLQGMVEAFGGELGVLDYPMHGKPSYIRHTGQGVFAGLPERFKVGRYHSLFARREALPDCLEITAESEDGIIMGVRHKTLAMEAVQFHPESLLSMEGACGLALMRNVMAIPVRVAAR